MMGIAQCCRFHYQTRMGMSSLFSIISTCYLYLLLKEQNGKGVNPKTFIMGGGDGGTVLHHIVKPNSRYTSLKIQ